MRGEQASGYVWRARALALGDLGLDDLNDAGLSKRREIAELVALAGESNGDESNEQVL